MSLTPADLSRLEELARAATPGKRTATPCAHDPEGCDYLRFEDGTDLLKTDSGTYPPEMPDARFIAACDTETILALVSMARRAPRWTPVEERLPADHGEWSEGVLVAVGQIGEEQIVVEATLFRPEGREPFWMNTNRGARVAPVTHWMPLPAPPEAAGDKAAERRPRMVSISLSSLSALLALADMDRVEDESEPAIAEAEAAIRDALKGRP